MNTRSLEAALPRTGAQSLSRSALVLGALVLMLITAACSAVVAPSPAATPSPPPSSEKGVAPGSGAQPPIGTDTSHRTTGDQPAVPGTSPVGVGAPSLALPDRTYQWVGVIVVSDLEGRHLELKRDCDAWVLLAEPPETTKKLESNIGKKVVIWGKVFSGATIYMRQTIAVQSAFGPDDPMPMTLIAIPEYPCPGQPAPSPAPVPMPQPVPPIAYAIDLLPGEIAARGKLVKDSGQTYLDTPSGRVLLVFPVQTLPAPKGSETPIMSPSFPATPGTAGGQSGTGSATPGVGSDTAAPEVMPAGSEYVAAGKWELKGGQLVITVRYLSPLPWVMPPTPKPVPVTPLPTTPVRPTPPPPPPATPASGQGVIWGKVTIGPLCPVEPCRNPQPDVYSSRALILQPATGKTVSIQLNADGSFKAAVDAGTYSVTLSNCEFMGCKRVLPKTVIVNPSQVASLEIDIDTGIR